MQNILSFGLIIALAVVAFACGNQNKAPTQNIADSGDTPTEAYKRLYAAVKSKNIESIRKEMSRKTLDLAVAAAQRQNKPLEKVLENGFTATTFSETLPEIRDERVNGGMGAVEVWNSTDRLWEDLPFVKEDGIWKFAMGEAFGGTFVSPGKGRDMKEKEAANLMRQNADPTGEGNSNAASNRNVAVPRGKPR